ncbi:MAG: class I SAM-dependent methyltransferase [Patescibacteria group bacterium]|jgi:SAM-dependent methyltransferase
MQNLPIADVYQKEFLYMPWGILMDRVQKIVIEKAPVGGRVLDLLCGPGYLLGELRKERSDLSFVGVDMEEEFISYATIRHPGIEFIVSDAAEWNTEEQYDVVLCTGGLHHLAYEKQELFLQKVARLLKSSGFAIIADPYIDEYKNEDERKLVGAKLGYEYLVATMKNGAPEDVIISTIGILQNDVLLVEFKSSIKKLQPIFEKTFSRVEKEKTWPVENTEYGDYMFILKP